jgi:two-component system, NtrC family, sensor kinase
MRVLVADDSSTVRLYLQETLCKGGYEVVLASNGDEAWGILTQPDAPRISILDWVMPGMTGIEICKRIRRLPDAEYRYVLLLTSRESKKDLIEGLDAGADDYLIKPISPLEIQARLRSAKRIVELQENLTAECEKVLEEKRRITLLLNSTAEGILGVDKNGRCTFANRAALAEFGYDSEDQLIGKELHAAVHHSQLDGTPYPMEECCLLRALHNEQPAHFECDYFFRRDGTGFPVEFWAYPTEWEDKVVGAVVTFWNITQRQDAENAHRRSEKLFKSIAENSADMIAVMDPRGKRIYNNPVHYSILGFTPAELKQSMAFDHIHPDDRERVKQILNEALNSDKGLVAEYRVRRKDESYLTLESRGNSIRNSKGEIEALVLSSRDVEQRRSAEQAQKLSAIGQLASGIAHEINTPLQFVSNNILFLRESWKQLIPVMDLCSSLQCSSAEQKDALPHGLPSLSDLVWLREEVPNAISQSLEGSLRISKIVSAMRTFSDVGTANKTLVDINDALDTALTLAGNEIKPVATIETDFSLELPSVMCLGGEVTQVFLNLMVNAAQAIKDAIAKGIRTGGKLVVRTRPMEDEIQIEIQDNGSGISDTIRDRVFDPFFTTKPVGKGTGQSLSICHDIIVNKHLGRIWFESDTTRGTTFYVRIPVLGDMAKTGAK